MRTIVATFVIVTLLPFGGLVTSLQAATPDRQDGERARRIVTDLGTGQQVEVTLFRGERIRGEIRDIAADHFVVLPHGTLTPISIEYAHVRRLRPVGQQPSVRPSRSRLRVLQLIFLAAVYVVHIAECDKAC